MCYKDVWMEGGRLKPASKSHLCWQPKCYFLPTHVVRRVAQGWHKKNHFVCTHPCIKKGIRKHAYFSFFRISCSTISSVPILISVQVVVVKGWKREKKKEEEVSQLWSCSDVQRKFQNFVWRRQLERWREARIRGNISQTEILAKKPKLTRMWKFKEM